MPKNLVKPISFRGQDEELYLHLCKQPNVSKYVRELIRRDINGITSEDSQPNELLIEIRDLIKSLRHDIPRIEVKEDVEILDLSSSVSEQ